MFFAFFAFFAPLFFAKKAKNVNKFFAKIFAKNGRSNDESFKACGRDGGIIVRNYLFLGAMVWPSAP